MKLTDKQLRKIIKEELEAVLSEREWIDPGESFAGIGFGSDTEEERVQSFNKSKKAVAARTIRKVRDIAIRHFENRINETYGLGRSDIEKLLSKEGGVVVPEGRYKNQELYGLEDIAFSLIDKQLKDGLHLKDLKEDPKSIGNTIGIDMFKLINPVIKKNRTFLNKVGNFMSGGGYKE